MRNMKTMRSVTLSFVMLFATTTISHAQSRTAGIRGAQSVNEPSSPVLPAGMDMAKVNAAIFNILNDNIEIDDKKNQSSGTPENILVLDDRIEFKLNNQNIVFNYSDFVDDRISEPYFNGKTKYVLELEKFNFNASGYKASNLDRLKELKKYFIFIQSKFKEKRDSTQIASQLILFQKIAADYRALKVKPPIPEEQRKYIVQANSFNEQKMFDKAIELYIKAIETDQTSYPAAYSNLALLSAQVKKFDAAISYMKKYLLLVPEAEDARAAQDKIYEWEVETGK